MELSSRTPVSFGTDPEVFIFTEEGLPVPAHHFFPSQKEAKAVPNIDRYGSATLLYRDGFAAEINVAANVCRALLGNSIRTAFQSIRTKIGKQHIFASIPAIEIDLTTMEDAPSDVLTFGCNPSRNAYFPEQQGTPPINAMTHRFRYSGDHLHFGIHDMYAPDFFKKETEQTRLFVKMLDLYVGVPVTALLNSPEQYLRRRFYGQAGEYRLQRYTSAYGIEYRTPAGGVWNNIAVAALAFGVGRSILYDFEYFARTWDASLEPAIQRAINTGEGLFEVIRPFPRFYNADIIFEAAMSKAFHTNILLGSKDDLHRGWNEWCHTSITKAAVAFGVKSIDIGCRAIGV